MNCFREESQRNKSRAKSLLINQPRQHKMYEKKSMHTGFAWVFTRAAVSCMPIHMYMSSVHHNFLMQQPLVMYYVAVKWVPGLVLGSKGHWLCLIIMPRAEPLAYGILLVCVCVFAMGISESTCN